VGRPHVGSTCWRKKKGGKGRKEKMKGRVASLDRGDHELGGGKGKTKKKKGKKKKEGEPRRSQRRYVASLRKEEKRGREKKKKKGERKGRLIAMGTLSPTFFHYSGGREGEGGGGGMRGEIVDHISFGEEKKIEGRRGTSTAAKFRLVLSNLLVLVKKEKRKKEEEPQTGR